MRNGSLTSILFRLDAAKRILTKTSRLKNGKKSCSYLLNRMSAGCKTTILATAPQLARVALQCQGASGTGEVTMSMAHMQTVKVTKKAVPLGDFIGGCGAGRLYCSLSPQGDVHPCVFLPVNVGQPENRKVPGHLAKRTALQRVPQPSQPQRIMRQMRLQVHLRRLQGTLSSLP